MSLATTHPDLINDRSGTVVLFLNNTEDHDQVRGFVDKIEDADVQTTENSTFVPQFIKVLDRSNIDCLTVSGIFLLGEFTDLLGEVLILIRVEEVVAFIKSASEDLNGPTITGRRAATFFDTNLDRCTLWFIEHKFLLHFDRCNRRPLNNMQSHTVSLGRFFE